MDPKKLIIGYSYRLRGDTTEYEYISLFVPGEHLFRLVVNNYTVKFTDDFISRTFDPAFVAGHAIPATAPQPTKVLKPEDLVPGEEYIYKVGGFRLKFLYTMIYVGTTRVCQFETVPSRALHLVSESGLIDLVPAPPQGSVQTLPTPSTGAAPNILNYPGFIKGFWRVGPDVVDQQDMAIYTNRRTIECECGSDKVGSSQHSSWCPKHV